MELIRDSTKTRYAISQYRDGVIIVNQQHYDYPIIIVGDQRIERWEVKSFEVLSARHFDCLLPFSPQIVLFGTGQKSQFPDLHIFETLMIHRIPFEVMNTKAACGAYTLLMSEGKNVVAALIN